RVDVGAHRLEDVLEVAPADDAVIRAGARPPGARTSPARRPTPSAGAEAEVVGLLRGEDAAVAEDQVLPAQYAPERIAAADVQALIRRVDVRPAADLGARFPAETSVLAPSAPPPMTSEATWKTSASTRSAYAGSGACSSRSSSAASSADWAWISALK